MTPWLRRVGRRVRALRRSDSIHSQIDEELRFHIEETVAENVEMGMTEGEARRDAERRFGNLTELKEEGYDVRGGRWVETVVQDARHGARRLVRAPGFAAVAIVVLALGIGANTAVFSVVDAVLLEPLPYHDPSRLVLVWEDASSIGFSKNEPAPANYLAWREQAHSFEDIAATAHKTFNLTGVGEPEELDGQRVSANLFDLLGVRPALGRGFRAEDDRFGVDRVAVISDGVWARRFGRDPGVVGRAIVLDGATATVVGVMPPRFEFLVTGVDVWVPIAFEPDEARSRDSFFLDVVARLRPDVSIASARSEMSALAIRLNTSDVGEGSGFGVTVETLRDGVVGDVRPALYVLLAAVAFVMLIACANVANLLLARATERRKEAAIRTALGAGRFRLARQFLVEAVVLWIVGGAAGVLVAFGFVRALAALVPQTVLRAAEIGIDARMLVFAAGVSLFTGVLFGSVPAFEASRSSAREALNDGARGSTDGRGGKVRGALVVAEIALALVLLVGAGLLVNSFARLSTVDTGFDGRGLLALSLPRADTETADSPARRAFYERVLERVRALPGVRSAAVITSLPQVSLGQRSAYAVEGRPTPTPDNMTIAVTRVVSPEYFETMRIPVLLGRSFDARDTADAAPAVVVSDAMARAVWPGEDPIGRRISLSGNGPDAVWLGVVGVVGDVRQLALGADPQPQLYVDFAQSKAFPVQAKFFSPRQLVVRAESDPLALVDSVRSEIWSVDPDQPVSDVRTMQSITAQSLGRERFLATLLALFAGVALALAAVGIYGVMAYSVVRRSREIGIRMALGAEPRDVVRLVLGQSSKLVTVGLAIGLLGAFLLSRSLSSLLFGVGTADPLTFAFVALVLAIVALAASYIPAQRATRIDPLASVRAE